MTGYNGPERRNEEWAHQLARETVEELLTKYGFDTANPLEMQEDLAWIRRYRKMCDRVGGRVILTVVTIIVGGVVATVWAAVQSK